MKKENTPRMGSTVFWLTIFAISMAYLESAIVIYLRLLYYPEGFTFPLKTIPNQVLLIELGREAFTIIMLYAAARLAFNKAITRFAAFMLAFGIWDIFYYIWLYVFISWPQSLTTWDILFLIPVPWIGPVLVPVLISLSMITGALIIINLEMQGIPFYTNLIHWILAIAGGIIIILSFTLDYRTAIEQTVPVHYRWEIFLIGEFIGLTAFIHALRESMKRTREA